MGDKGIRISGNQVAGYQENRISGYQDKRGKRLRLEVRTGGAADA